MWSVRRCYVTVALFAVCNSSSWAGHGTTKISKVKSCPTAHSELTFKLRRRLGIFLKFEMDE